jgi:hypothetical protein
MTSEMPLLKPEKLGLGAYASFGDMRLFEDLLATSPSWFYTWSDRLPKVAIADWTIGAHANFVFGAEGNALELDDREDSWIMQAVTATDGQYTLEGRSAGPERASGGVTLTFYDTSGATLAKDWLMLSSSGSTVRKEITAPEETATAEILAWVNKGKLQIESLALSGPSGNVLLNSQFERAVQFDQSPLREDFVPMIWGSDDATPEALTMLSDAEVLLGFNEPDRPDQAGMSVEQALELWPLLASTGARLGSPAVTARNAMGEGAWLTEFMNGASVRNLPVDFIAVHYYAEAPDVAAFEAFLMDLHAAYSRPVWVTEWALIDYQDLRRHSDEAVEQFFIEAVLMLDRLDFVERHAWFGM